jgi:hypothetical protein
MARDLSAHSPRPSPVTTADPRAAGPSTTPGSLTPDDGDGVVARRPWVPHSTNEEWRWTVGQRAYSSDS